MKNSDLMWVLNLYMISESSAFFISFGGFSHKICCLIDRHLIIILQITFYDFLKLMEQLKFFPTFIQITCQRTPYYCISSIRYALLILSLGYLNNSIFRRLQEKIFPSIDQFTGSCSGVNPHVLIDHIRFLLIPFTVIFCFDLLNDK